MANPTMQSTPNLALPYIMPAQAQKHVTHNEAIRTLDALAQCAVIDRNRTSPPTAPDEGDCHIVATGATGGWANHDFEIAAFQDGGWFFYAPHTGCSAWSIADDRLIVWNGTAWATADRPGPTGGAFGFAYDDNVNMGDPGSGLFRLDNSTPALATTMSFAANASNGRDVSDMLIARFNPAPAVKCRIVVTFDSGRLEFDATAITDHGAWLEATVQSGVMAGALADQTSCEIVFEWRS